jgi:DNA-directed RNA polymerase subunit RPC12/RpoP
MKRDVSSNLISKKRLVTLITYICQKCHAEISPEELETLPGIRCIICGHRILLKKRPPIVKRLKAN